uniref:ATP-binding protein n=1 Tax=Phocaeicola sartorii TaxID=671267 RepID=UPI0025849E09
MEQQQLKRCPIGVQTFEKVIEGNYLYIDKTEYIYRMAHGASNYYFLSRPRRFGKSLLVSTLHSYFSGKKELFKGLAIEKLENEWTEYPVLHFDMSRAKHVDKEKLNEYLVWQLRGYNEKYGLTKNNDAEVNIQLADLIKRACEQTGRQVVVLIDEYDAPLLDVMHEETDLPVLRNVMRNFYSPLKACDPYLRFVFLTGITKFSQLSIFSELNNISNISMLKPYAAICGITQEEMQEQMAGYIERLAFSQEMTKEETLRKLKEKYDGYHFTWPSPDIYNPFSLLNAFANDELNAYWFGSGTPTYLIE